MQHAYRFFVGLCLAATVSAANTPVSLALESLHYLAEARGAISAKRFAPAWESVERARPYLHNLAKQTTIPMAHTEGLVAAAQKALEKKDFLRADLALQEAEDHVRANILAGIEAAKTAE